MECETRHRCWQNEYKAAGGGYRGLMSSKKKKDPKVGTGKKPKGSGRRLYTDENPKDTVSIKFATPADARATVAKVKKINKPYARKIQILTVGEQRAKVMGKTEVVAIFKKAKEQLKKQHERKKKKDVILVNVMIAIAKIVTVTATKEQEDEVLGAPV